MMTPMQNRLSRIAEYRSREIANKVMQRYLRQNRLPYISSYPPVVVACAQHEKREYVSETKHIRREHIHEMLLDELEYRLETFIGEKSKYADNSYVGYCAEPNAVNELLRHERLNSFDDVYFGKAYRPRTGVVIPPCGNCRKMFNNVIK